jgi:nicotinate-nucleotide pyrophosphorylase (carboxylating)
MARFNLPPEVVADAVRRALDEDLGRAGDITSAAVIPKGTQTVARIVARQSGLIAGMALAAETFRALDRRIAVETLVDDGAAVAGSSVLAELSGSAHAILAGERTALNFIGHLSGIASATAAFVDAVKGTKARITCTRKTTPGLRALEKYAVACGGGVNHRFGLDDAVLIKDNHIAIAGSVAGAIRAARKAVGHLVKVEVEVDNIAQLAEAMTAGPDVVLLDNMTPEELAEAVDFIGGKAGVEASGGVKIGTVRNIAEAGVDYISSGWITHSAPALDVGLDIGS